MLVRCLRHNKVEGGFDDSSVDAVDEGIIIIIPVEK